MKSFPTNPVALLPSQIAPAGHTLARAFFADPMFAYISPEESRREQVAREVHTPMVRYGHHYGEVFTTAKMEGVAVWLPPGETEMSFWRMLRSGVMKIPLKIPFKSFQRLMSIEKPAEDIRKKAISGKYWYLVLLGVDPLYQGKGIGGTILNPVLEKADRAGQPCYLETMNETNLAFYIKKGFAVADQCEVTSKDNLPDRVQIWGMVRQPQKR
jgi:ribosomal protein S18 acetylase RimI-like enzyme